jgi:uncharacterized protein YbbK (DUF523 family)
MIIVSACLAGSRCAHDGKARTCAEVAALVKSGKAVPVCPEVLGGFPVPRECIELRNGRAVTESGMDVTEGVKRGAMKALEAAKRAGCRRAILKARSPSCGCGKIYDGTFSGRLVAGDGMFAKLLVESGIRTEPRDADTRPGKL